MLGINSLVDTLYNMKGIPFFWFAKNALKQAVEF